ncbi:MAG: CesT family type III secretion system chaperone [Chlamydiota bacterium]
MRDFATLLEELGDELMTELRPDTLGHCRIVFEDRVAVQIQEERSHGKLLVAAELGEVPPGAFREEILQAAMIINGVPPPWYGILAYSKDRDSLAMCEYLDNEHITGKELGDYLKAFSHKALTWIDAIESNRVPQVIFPDQQSTGGGLFGMR